MQPTEIVRDLEARGIEKIKVGGFDVDGVLRGKYVSRAKLASALESGFGFCDVIFGWDLDDVLYDSGRDPAMKRAVTGWHTGYPDAHAKIDPTTYRILPWEPSTAAFLVDFFEGDGARHPACTRGLLRTVLERLEQHGLRAKVACELEFWLFRETPASVRAKGYRGLEPISPGMFGYSWLREGQHQELLHAILDECRAFDVEIEGLHTETGPGVYEVALRYDDALRAADKAALFKTCVKQICARFGVIPTFMAKWSADLPGSSGHLHQSLWRDGQNVMFEAGAEGSLSRLGRHFVGGQIALMPALTAIYSPTVNAYKRYVPGVWAPLTASWGIENRTTAIRVIPCGPTSTRIEYRQTAADINPYTAIAACLGAGLRGIEERIEPPPASNGDASAGTELTPLPRTLTQAVELLDRSEAARKVLGDRFVDHYVMTRRHEVARFERAVTSWELERYFEII